MDPTNAGKSANSSFTIRYNVNNEELEDVFPSCEDDPPTPHNDSSPNVPCENASPKRIDKSSILDKYFKSNRTEKSLHEDIKTDVPKNKDEEKSSSQKDVNSSPMKEYLNRLGKRSKDSELKEGDVKDGTTETWKLFHDFRFKIAQAVEDIKSSRSVDDKEKSVPRESSVSDSEENSAIRDSDQQSIGDTDNQVSSLDSSIQNLSEVTQPITAKVLLTETSLPCKDRTVSESSDDTQKNFSLDEAQSKEPCEEDSLDVESGVEALEALEESNIDGSLLMEELAAQSDWSQARPPGYAPPDYLKSPLLPLTNNSSRASFGGPKNYFFTFSMIFYTILLLISYTWLYSKPMWNGFVFGVWLIHFASALKDWLLDWLCDSSDNDNRTYFMNKQTAPPSKQRTYTIPSIKEHRPMKKYEGWINHYRCPEYDPYTYHINKTTTAFMKLEDSNLRISYTRKKISKKAFWDEAIDKVTFYQHRLYNLAGARVILMPKGLVKKRLWSKKYPICVILNENEKVQVLEKEPCAVKREGSVEKTEQEHAENASSTETTKPRKKFVWRRKDRADSIDSSKGLRQRISRRIHRDKKTEDASTSTEPMTVASEQHGVTCEVDYFEPGVESTSKSGKDDNHANNEKPVEEDTESDQYKEYMRLKDFLDEAEELDAGATAEKMPENGEAPTEWSLHVKESGEMQRQLYIFARTGRDKAEWYRRIHAAIAEANSEMEGNGEQSTSESAREHDMSVYKVADKDAIAYAKPSVSAYNVAPEPLAVSWADETLKAMDLTAHEKEFWPYMYKIIQAHQVSDVGSTSVQCSSKAKKKKKKTVNKASSSAEPEAPGSLPMDVAWLNSVLGRVAYDAMRNPAVVTRIQRRIQRKLSTLKLPSFMGELLATELSLGTASPLVEVVAGPACDERGVWLDAVVHYDGGAYITINTQINLMKLKEKNVSLEEQLEQLEVTVDQDVDLLKDLSATIPPLPHKKPAIFDSDLDDSAESSSDEDSGAAAAPVLLDDKPPPTAEQVPSAESGSSAKKFLRMVDKIAKSSYFQQLSDYKYVKRAMEGLSNTDIKLHLELKGLEGRLAINLPPPPHDRIWIGFRDNPRIWLKARPALGARAVRFTHITRWIEQRLCKEFEKVLVLPNMEDLVLDLLTPTPVEFE